MSASHRAAVPICHEADGAGVTMETHLTGRVIKAAEESERQASTAFMEEEFNLSERQLHFTGGGGLILYLLSPSICSPLPSSPVVKRWRLTRRDVTAEASP